MNVGNIYTYKSKVTYKVQSRKYIINIIIPHFDNYTIITEKQNDFKIFKEILAIQDNSLYSSTKIIKVLNLKSLLNKGLFSLIKKQFLNIPSIKRPKRDTYININPYSLAGFFSGEGCFFYK